MNTQTAHISTTNRKRASGQTEAISYTRSLACCQNQELLELLEIQAEQGHAIKPMPRWAKKIKLAFKSPELTCAGRLAWLFVALCMLVIASTLLAMMMV